MALPVRELRANLERCPHAGKQADMRRCADQSTASAASATTSHSEAWLTIEVTSDE